MSPRPAKGVETPPRDPAKATFRASLPKDVQAQLETGQGRAAVDRLWRRHLESKVARFPDRETRQVRRAIHRARIRSMAKINREAKDGFALNLYRKGQLKTLARPARRRHATAL